MTYPQFIGTGVALITPFNTRKEIDYPALKRLLEHTYAQGSGVDYWVVMGTTGESATLQPEEKKQVLQFVKENNPKNIPIVYGIGGNDTQAVLHQFKNTDLEGVQAILSASPAYNKPSQAGIYAHYHALAEASPLPVILYNVPGRTASNVSAETTLHLAEHPNIIGTKEASGNLEQCLKISQYKPKDFLLISGDDMLTLPLISLGGQGVISVLANAFPVIFRKMTAAALQGDFEAARAQLFKISAINPLMYEESNPVGVKQALELLEVCSAEVRMPLLPASEDLKKRIQLCMPDKVKV